ncbi:methyltransferase domain-containing protein [Phytohalomonas tamaricis]|uniref:methyltransferase domain-containing protein n=1 Tax=Phytohalomonas tamaricis TaxID=2081032 RepID=UPI002948BD30|nr:methyltransferase domain-containing protein [Phytohalomonas tamaricis]
MTDSIPRDRHFDGMADKFARSLYGASRGRLRLQLLQHTLQSQLPLTGQPVLDVGAGLGQMAHWAAQRGHPVTLAEPSLEMLERARELVNSRNAVFHHCALQQLDQYVSGQWPLVFCHAVLEWMVRPAEAIPLLSDRLAPGGWLSLMVFNHDAMRFSNIVKGNLERVLVDRLAGTGKRKRLTPISPLVHDDVMQWLSSAGLEVRAVTGIRVFHDYLRERHPSEEDLERLTELELRYCRTEPYWRLGRYLHYSVYKPER